MSGRGWWSAVIGIGLAVGLAVPAGAAETTFTDTCDEVYGHRAIGDLDKTTDPPPGSQGSRVHPSHLPSRQSVPSSAW